MALFKVSITFLVMFLSVVRASEPHTKSRECPPFWISFGDSCYRFFGTPKTWQEAENHCQEFFTRYGQGHLASVRNQEENKFLQQLWSSLLVPRDDADFLPEVWIGLTDIEQEGTFVWSDGTTAFFTQWFSGQPNNWEDNQHCDVFRNTDGDIGWHDLNCNLDFPYICKISL